MNNKTGRIYDVIVKQESAHELDVKADKYTKNVILGV